MNPRLALAPVVPALLALLALGGCSSATPDATGGAPAPATAAGARREVGIASFNMAWAGTMQDFERQLAVCGAPEVSWCDTRARVAHGATAPTPEEQARATRCQEAQIAAAGGREALALVAPCGAYRGGPQKDPAASRTREAYAGKLDGLKATVSRLIEKEGISVLAFQEVRGKALVEEVLGSHSGRFEVCAAPHTSFQTVAFAWDRAVTERPGTCAANDALAIVESKAEPWRRVRPGLALELTIGVEPVTFLNVHLKASCANIVPTERFAARLLTDPVEACQVFNRQVPILERWIEDVAARSPRLVWLGDFNRRIEEEAAASIARSDVRADASDPAGPNPADAKGNVPTRYLWPEIADGSPVLHQVPLSTSEGGCTGFMGLDHVVISDALRSVNPGAIPSRKVAVEQAPGQAIETSDHCPRIVRLRF